MLIDGQRLAVPDAAELPAPIAAFEGLGGYVALMQQCWVQEPSQRPSFADICVDLRWGTWHAGWQDRLCRLAAVRALSVFVPAALPWFLCATTATANLKVMLLGQLGDSLFAALAGMVDL